MLITKCSELLEIRYIADQLECDFESKIYVYNRCFIDWTWTSKDIEKLHTVIKATIAFFERQLATATLRKQDYLEDRLAALITHYKKYTDGN